MRIINDIEARRFPLSSSQQEIQRQFCNVNYIGLLARRASPLSCGIDVRNTSGLKIVPFGAFSTIYKLQTGVRPNEDNQVKQFVQNTFDLHSTLQPLHSPLALSLSLSMTFPRERTKGDCPSRTRQTSGLRHCTKGDCQRISFQRIAIRQTKLCLSHAIS